MKLLISLLLILTSCNNTKIHRGTNAVVQSDETHGEAGKAYTDSVNAALHVNS